jgi:peptide-N4-(N-acetyl-beta-glucosaminyl)asparagine amidase
LYRCAACNVVTRFPRYNHAGKLMKTKRGRCGEWAQAFVLAAKV